VIDASKNLTNIGTVGCGAVTCGAITSSGNIVTTGDVTAFYSTSDAKFKEDVTPMPSVLETLRRTRPVEFTWNGECPNPTKEGTRDAGLIAQELREVMPQLVEESGRGHLLVRYEKLVPYLLKAVQELSEEVRLLK